MNYRILVITFAMIGMSTRSLLACTIFMSANSDIVLVGNNEDWSCPNGLVNFLPASEGKHGVVYFGHTTGWAQGGMNDQGLFYDYAATKRLTVTQSSHKPQLHAYEIINRVMTECSTVDEALAVFDIYYLSFMA